MIFARKSPHERLFHHPFMEVRTTTVNKNLEMNSKSCNFAVHSICDATIKK